MFFQRYPVLLEAGVLDPVIDNLVISGIKYAEAADLYDVVQFDFSMVAATAAASGSNASWWFSQNGNSSAFGQVRQPDANASAVRPLIVSVFGVCPETAGVTAAATGKVRVIGITGIAKGTGASSAFAKGEALCPTGGADTVQKATGALSAKIIAIATGRNTGDTGVSLDADTTGQCFLNGFGFGQDT